MEYSLTKCFRECINGSSVLILVLMEYSLTAIHKLMPESKWPVLILVLMEYSLTNFQLRYDQNTNVLILILMEFSD